jgi:hypothetical protein
MVKVVNAILCMVKTNTADHSSFHRIDAFEKFSDRSCLFIQVMQYVLSARNKSCSQYLTLLGTLSAAFLLNVNFNMSELFEVPAECTGWPFAICFTVVITLSKSQKLYPRMVFRFQNHDVSYIGR